MSAGVTSIVDRREAAEDKPSVTVRQAGDRALLVEYGEMEFDLALNFFVLAMDTALREKPVDGLIETAPGFRSLMATYDPLKLPVGDLVDHLRAVYDELRSSRPPGRLKASLQAEDGVTFVHIAETEEGQNPLREVAAFARFQEGIAARCVEPPVATALREIGSYRFFGDESGP